MSLILKAITTQEGTLKTDDGYDKHIACEGSREHVLSYTNNGIHCSHRNCIVNKNNQSNIEHWIFIQA